MTTSRGGLGDAYRETIAALEERGRFGIRLGLARTRALLRALGDPHEALPGALVAGTNGKGSVQAIAASILCAAGHRVAQTPKPHLVSYRERIQVGGHPIAAVDFVPLVGEVLHNATRIERRHGPPTEFEVLTAAAFTWFARAGAGIGVIEVGLGGRLDATNAWDGGVAAITNVELDHTERLGTTVEAIAREKAAIIKRGDLAVTGATGAGLAAVRRRARRLRAPLAEVEPLVVHAMSRMGLVLEHQRLGDLRLGLIGRHQASNAAVAIAVVEALAQTGVAVPETAFRRGLADARWPGRLELLTLRPGRNPKVPPQLPHPEAGVPDVLLDGAHNVAGMAAFVAALEELRPSLSPGRPTLLLALMRDKDVAGIVGVLRTSAVLRGARIIATTMATDRSLPATRLAAAWGPGAEAVEVVGDAIERASSAALETDGPLVVAGSLYLVGAVRERFVDDPAVRDPA